MNDTDRQRIIGTLTNCENIQDSAEYFEQLRQIKTQFNQTLTKTQFVNFFIAFGNKDRFLILDSLKQQDRCVCELETIIDKSQPAVSHHLKVLENMHLIRGWKKGKFTYYSLVEKTFTGFETLWKEWSKEITNWFGK